MDSFTLEITAHRIGGAEDFPERTWGPWATTVHPTAAWQRHSIPGRLNSNIPLEVTFQGPWVPVRPGLVSASAQLADVTGCPLGTARAVLVSTLPSDVPLYCAFPARHPDAGVFSLGLRIPTIAWLPKHLAPEDEPATL